MTISVKICHFKGILLIALQFQTSLVVFLGVSYETDINASFVE